MMNQENIIADLIIWIEKNLEKPLSIDHVAEKSGYSKWHLQRMFKAVTGQILGTYIRHRRLTHAALALRLTSKPILEIAMQYRFDSQQTFTRSFKNQFNITPATYRRNTFWTTKGLMPPVQLKQTKLQLPEPRFIHIPERTFWGITYKNNCNLNELLQHNAILRHQFFSDYFYKYFKNKNQLQHKIYAFTKINKSKENIDDQEVLYTICIEDNTIIEKAEKHICEGGLYICFKYVGEPGEFLNFVSQIYFAAIPALNVQLRPSEILEIHYDRNNLTSSDDLDGIQIVECDYCVPIMDKSNSK